MNLVVVGSIAYDTIETPSGSVDHALGGSATYFSVSASYFTQVGLVGIVGEDFSSRDKEIFAARNIDTGGLEKAPGKTFHWKGDYLGSLNEARTHETHLNVFESFHPNLPETFRDSSHIFLANIDPVLQSEVLDQMSAPRMTACDTMNYWIENRLDELKKVLQRVNLLVINDTEVKLLSGMDNIFLGARTIRSWGPDYVVVKRGEFGAALLGESERFIIPAFPLERVVDPTGAGDSFAGGFMGYLARTGGIEGIELRKAMLYGTVMASFAVENFSLNRLLQLGKEDIEKRYAEFCAMIQL